MLRLAQQSLREPPVQSITTNSRNMRRKMPLHSSSMIRRTSRVRPMRKQYQPQYCAPPLLRRTVCPPPQQAPAQDDLTAKLQQLAQLHNRAC